MNAIVANVLKTLLVSNDNKPLSLNAQQAMKGIFIFLAAVVGLISDYLLDKYESLPFVTLILPPLTTYALDFFSKDSDGDGTPDALDQTPNGEE